jgi:hypothetical protein
MSIMRPVGRRQIAIIAAIPRGREFLRTALIFFLGILICNIMVHKTIGDQLRLALADARLRQADVVRRTGLPPAVVSRFFAGRGATLATADRLVDGLGLAVTVAPRATAEREPAGRA